MKNILIIILLCFFLVGCVPLSETVVEEESIPEVEEISCPDKSDFLIKFGSGGQGSVYNKYILNEGQILVYKTSGPSYDPKITIRFVETNIENFTEFVEQHNTFDWENYQKERDLVCEEHSCYFAYIEVEGLDRIGYNSNSDIPSFILEFISKYSDQLKECNSE